MSQSPRLRQPRRTGRASDRPYVFYVGNYKPHKNFSSLLSALTTAKTHCNVKLLATGVAPAEVQASIDRLGLGSSVEFLGHLTDAQLAEAYRGAAATVLPSEYEGFGLPVIESMACGTAVVCSNVTSLPEVAGGAAELVDPDSDSIADGMLRVIDERDRREHLVALEEKRASEFSWHSTAARVQRVLDEMLYSDD